MNAAAAARRGSASARATLCALALGAAACGGSVGEEPTPALDLGAALAGGDPAGFLRATEPPRLEFPRDHGPHAGFRTEWWYWTGNVAAADGRAFGFELVFFRQALAPPAGPAAEPRAAALAATELVLAHAAVTDVAAGRFHAAERLLRRDSVRAGMALVGDGVELFCGDWTAAARGDGERFVAGALAARGPEFAFALTLGAGKPLVRHGDGGLSQKGDQPGNASIYYSATRLPCSGTIEVDGASFAVRGAAWCDREWSTSALGPEQAGWDWFSLQFDDGTELMWYRLRRRDGAPDAHSMGTFVQADGSTVRLGAADVQLEPVGTWHAADGRASYPAAWRLRAPALALDVEVVPRVADQELHTAVRYWEGSVAVRGARAGRPVGGLGYLEMTGYAR